MRSKRLFFCTEQILVYTSVCETRQSASRCIKARTRELYLRIRNTQKPHTKKKTKRIIFFCFFFFSLFSFLSPISLKRSWIHFFFLGYRVLFYRIMATLQLAHHHAKQRHSDGHAILHLPEVRCPWVRVNLWMDLAHHLLFGLRHDVPPKKKKKFILCRCDVITY